jgi:hypothetical protein
MQTVSDVCRSHCRKLFIVVVPGLMPEAFRGRRLRLHAVSNPWEQCSCEAIGEFQLILWSHALQSTGCADPPGAEL